MRVSIDGTDFEAPRGTTVLRVAQAAGLDSIPSWCDSSALASSGSCRLCSVEVQAPIPYLAAACTLRVSEGLAVLTDSPRVRTSRGLTLAYLLQRDRSEGLVRIARRFAPELLGDGFEEAEEPAGCSLCGVCVRTCEALGVQALQFVGRGAERRVERASSAGANACVGCRACERMCPSGHIGSVIGSGVLRFADDAAPLPVAECASCGRPYATKAAVAHVVRKVSASRARADRCPECKRSFVIRPVRNG